MFSKFILLASILTSSVIPSTVSTQVVNTAWKNYENWYNFSSQNSFQIIVQDTKENTSGIPITESGTAWSWYYHWDKKDDLFTWYLMTNYHVLNGASQFNNELNHPGSPKVAGLSDIPVIKGNFVLNREVKDNQTNQVHYQSFYSHNDLNHIYNLDQTVEVVPSSVSIITDNKMLNNDPFKYSDQVTLFSDPTYGSDAYNLDMALLKISFKTNLTSYFDTWKIINPYQDYLDSSSDINKFIFDPKTQGFAAGNPNQDSHNNKLVKQLVPQGFIDGFQESNGTNNYNLYYPYYRYNKIIDNLLTPGASGSPIYTGSDILSPSFQPNQNTVPTGIFYGYALNTGGRDQKDAKGTWAAPEFIPLINQNKKPDFSGTYKNNPTYNVYNNFKNYLASLNKNQIISLNTETLFTTINAISQETLNSDWMNQTTKVNQALKNWLNSNFSNVEISNLSLKNNEVSFDLTAKPGYSLEVSSSKNVNVTNSKITIKNLEFKQPQLIKIQLNSENLYTNLNGFAKFQLESNFKNQTATINNVINAWLGKNKVNVDVSNLNIDGNSLSFDLSAKTGYQVNITNSNNVTYANNVVTIKNLEFKQPIVQINLDGTNLYKKINEFTKTIEQSGFVNNASQIEAIINNWLSTNASNVIVNNLTLKNNEVSFNLSAKPGYQVNITNSNNVTYANNVVTIKNLEFKQPIVQINLDGTNLYKKINEFTKTIEQSGFVNNASQIEAIINNWLSTNASNVIVNNLTLKNNEVSFNLSAKTGYQVNITNSNNVTYANNLVTIKNLEFKQPIVQINLDGTNLYKKINEFTKTIEQENFKTSIDTIKSIINKWLSTYSQDVDITDLRLSNNGLTFNLTAKVNYEIILEPSDNVSYSNNLVTVKNLSFKPTEKIIPTPEPQPTVISLNTVSLNQIINKFTSKISESEWLNQKQAVNNLIETWLGNNKNNIIVKDLTLSSDQLSFKLIPKSGYVIKFENVSSNQINNQLTFNNLKFKVDQSNTENKTNNETINKQSNNQEAIKIALPIIFSIIALIIIVVPTAVILQKKKKQNR